MINWILQLVVAVILLQTLYFKFTGASESVYIFESLGIVELIASILILIPRTTLIETLLGLGIMIGVVFLHVTKLGIKVNNDGGILFVLELIKFTSCGILIFVYKEKLPALVKFKI